MVPSPNQCTMHEYQAFRGVFAKTKPTDYLLPAAALLFIWGGVPPTLSGSELLIVAPGKGGPDRSETH